MPSIHSKANFSTIRRKFKFEKILIIPHYSTSISIADSTKDYVFLKIMHLRTAQVIKRSFCQMKTIELRDKGLNRIKKRFIFNRLIQMDRKMRVLRSSNRLLLKR